MKLKKGYVKTMSYKIAALGDNDFMFPFRQIGVEVFEPAQGVGLLRQVAQLIQSGYCLFFISENYLSDTPLLLTMYDKHPYVTIIPVPGSGKDNIGMERIQSMIEKALGQNIL